MPSNKNVAHNLLQKVSTSVLNTKTSDEIEKLEVVFDRAKELCGMQKKMLDLRNGMDLPNV